jgi:glyoxylase-like metal-dependent hydrolase (beta-lactamase superfamily II)
MVGVVPKPSSLYDFANSVVDTEHGSKVNRITHELTEVDDNLAVVESFSHVWVVRTAAGLVLFDASGAPSAPKVIAAIRQWSTDPIHSIVVTHGHIDHVGGVATFIADAERRGDPRPSIIGHRNVAPRLARYRKTNGYNTTINQRQFRPGMKLGMSITDAGPFVPDGTPDPDVSFDDSMTLTVGDDRFVLRHDKGETDDHAWTSWEGHDTLFVGDFLIWNFPNCGNPQKVLRYPAEWAVALRNMAARNPKVVGPAHGLPLFGDKRADRVLGSTATALEGLVKGVIDLLNQDASLDEVLHTVTVPEELLALPWLKPFYDEPEFVVRNIWRTYGGWWDRNPAHLHPPREASVAAEVVALAGGVDPVVRRVTELIAEGDLRTAGELLETHSMSVHTKCAPRSTTFGASRRRRSWRRASTRLLRWNPLTSRARTPRAANQLESRSCRASVLVSRLLRCVELCGDDPSQRLSR